MSDESNTMYRPGNGPRDFCSPCKSGAELLAAVKSLVEGPVYRPRDLKMFFGVHRVMGMPRAWQLEGMNDLDALPSSVKATLREEAREALAQLKSGQKYFFVTEPYPNLPTSMIERMDLTDEDEIEKRHWAWTMPVAFVEGMANLSD